MKSSKNALAATLNSFGSVRMANMYEITDETEEIMDFSLLNDDFLLILDNNYVPKTGGGR